MEVLLSPKMVFKGRSDLPPFEESQGPWFGPTKRARHYLDRRTAVMGPVEALEDLREVLRGLFRVVQHVRFVDSFRIDKQYRFTVALCWTADDPEVRDALYYAAEAMVSRSGWYPIPQGRRLGSVRNYGNRGGLGRPGARHVNGRLRNLANAVPPDGGCAVRVGLDSGDSILLDSGLPGALTQLNSDKAQFITHLHLDHSGGVLDGRVKGIPVHMSRATAQLLTARGYDLDRNQLVDVEPGDEFALGDSVSVEVFAVPHAPGSVGYHFRDRETAIIFTGDVSLSTARHDFISQLANRVQARSQACWLLLDATMAGRGDGASQSRSADLARMFH